MIKNNPIWNIYHAENAAKVRREVATTNTAIQWIIEPAEVIDIILDSKHPDYKDDRDIGSIRIRVISSPLLSTETQSNLFIAKPATPYIKKYPLKHEIVAVFKASDTLGGEIHQAISYYYLDIINVWGMINHNILPGASYIPDTKTNNKNYINFTGNTAEKQVYKVDVSDTFIPNENVSDLQPYEGDVIWLGRWGQTIRFGSTVNSANIKNTWSSAGTNGDPIIILQASKATKNAFYRVEDINKDASSIYICDGQTIGLELPAIAANSFNLAPTKPKSTTEYAGKQVLISSDRVILSAKTDAILLNAKKTIWLSSNGSINIDANKNLALDANKIYLGGNATEPAALGTQLASLLTELITTIIQDATTPITVVTPAGPGTTTPSTYIPKYSQLLSKIQSIISKKVFVE